MGSRLLVVDLLLIGLLGVFITAVYGYPMEDLVVSLPGQPKVNFRQFAGYIDVDEKTGKSLFYYFVEAVEDAANKPVTLWLSGGPGCSSVGGGAFIGFGPFNPRGDGRALVRNHNSWNKVSNLLFVDSPAGVGWSYSNTSSDYNAGDASTANDMHVFLVKWYEKFSELKSNDLFLIGESYAGHYIPQLADVLLEHNAHSTGFKFNIKGVAVGNPLLNAKNVDASNFEYLWSHGMISDEIHLKIISECNFDDYVYVNGSNACLLAINDAGTAVGKYIDIYDVILDVCYPSIVEQELKLRKMITKISVGGVDVCISYETDFYFNIPAVQHAFHANRTNIPYSWSMCSNSSNVLNYTDSDKYIDILPVLKKIIHHKIPVWVYSGDQDSTIPLTGSRTIVRELAQDLHFNVTVPYSAWFQKGQVGGWATEYGNLLTFATVRAGAHSAPYSQPARALQLFSSFVSGKRLPDRSNIPISD